MRRISVLILIISLATASGLSALSSEEAVKKFNERMQKLETMTGNIMWTDASGTIFTGTFHFMAPGKIHVKFSNPAGKTIISNGNKLWVYDSKSNVCGVFNLARSKSGGIAALVDGYNGIVKEQGNGFVIKLKNDEKAYPEITLMVDSTFLLKKAQLKTQDGRGISMSFTNVKAGVDISTRLFNFDPPENTYIIRN